MLRYFALAAALLLALPAQARDPNFHIFLCLGQSNNGDTSWPAQVQALYERLLNDLDLDATEVPLLVGELVNADQGGACASMNKIIAMVPGLIPTAHVISSAGAPSHRDHLHFTPAGYHLLGHRFAETMLPLLGYPAIAPARTRVPADATAAAVPAAVQLFDLADVTLLPSPFRDAMERHRAYLLRLDPDRFLHTFRLNVGLSSDAEPYGGWEAPSVELRGHSAGHYLTACALMYRSTGDAAFKARVDAIVAGFAACQAAAVDAGFNAGYLSAFPESFIDRVEAREPVWAPWYTLHKIMAGLLDANRLAGNARARDVLLAMTDWVAIRVDGLSSERMQASLENEFGGMNDVLAAVYALTGNPKHLRLGQAFDHAKVFDPLARGEDALDGLHANTQIPKVIGAAREYALIGDERYDHIARFFWERVALHRSFAIGGNSDREHFFPVDNFGRHLSTETAETCNTYNMLKLSRALFAQEPDARYMDFYERGLYNHILASQDPARGMFTYLMSLASGHFKTYSLPEDAFWCCVGTGMENHAKYGDTIFAHTADTLFVNLYLPTAVHWQAKGVILTQATTYPQSPTVTFTVDCAEPVAFTLRLRHPGWAAAPLQVALNDTPAADLDSTPGSYASLTRTWQPGDRLTLTVPLALRTEPLPGNPDQVALFYGPVALAAALGQDGMPAPYAGFQLAQARFPLPAVPALVTERSDWLDAVEKISNTPLLFRTRGLARPQDVTLVPFNALHHERSAVYLQLLTPAAWEARQQTVAETEAQLAAARNQAVDHVTAGDASSEAAHGYTGKGTANGVLSGHTWRQAQQAGSFSYILDTAGHHELTVLCAIGARDLNRPFEIWIGDTQLEPPPEFTVPTPGLVRTFSLPIPAELTRGQSDFTVRFQSLGPWDSATPNLFECLLVPTP